MPEKCIDSCPVLPRVEALERINSQHSATHREIFGRLNSIERGESVQAEQYKTIMEKLDTITDKVEDLERKPAKRWEGIVEKALWAVCAAVIAFLLGRVGL